MNEKPIQNEVYHDFRPLVLLGLGVFLCSLAFFRQLPAMHIQPLQAMQGASVFVWLQGYSVEDGLYHSQTPITHNLLASFLSGGAPGSGYEKSIPNFCTVTVGGNPEFQVQDQILPAIAVLFGMPLSVNQAGAAQFEILPGIGPSLAGNIVSYRAKHGFFQSVDDLLEVKGIGAKKLGGIKDSLTVP